MTDKPGTSHGVTTKIFYSTKLRPSKIEKYIATTLSSGSEDDELDNDDDVLDPDFSSLLDTEELEIDDEQDQDVEPMVLKNISTESQNCPKQGQAYSTRLNWKRIDQQDSQYSLPAFQEISSISTTCETPLDYFKLFVSDELLDEISLQTNLYAAQKDPNASFSLTTSELEQWLGTSMLMSVTKITNTRLHWSEYAANDKISSTMSRKRWEAIKANLHLVDNSKLDPSDKLAKVRLLLDHLREKFQKLPMEEHLSVDEQIVPFKGASSMKQYIPKKPHKWGYKIFVLAGSSGLVYDFIPYTGKIAPVDRPGVPDLGASGNSVLHLAECIPDGNHFKLFFDNWFTSVKLVEHLASRKIMACGTIQERRLRGVTFKNDKQLQKLGRGSFDEHTLVEPNVTLTAVKWHDNKAVSLLSSYLNSFPVEHCRRFDKKKKEYVEVPLPNIVSEYNNHMGGVDLHDQFMSYYRMSFRSKKYYLRLIFHMFDMAVVNSWVLLRKAETARKTNYHQLTSLCEFKLRLANALIFANKDVVKKRGRPSAENVQQNFKKKKLLGHATKPLPDDSIRKDGIGHYPIHFERRGTCKFPKCSGRVYMFCMKCQVHLCCDRNRNCFLSFHQE